MYQDVENVILKYSQRNSGNQYNEVPVSQKLTNV